MPRLFVAALPPDDVLAPIAALPRPDVAGLRWTTRDQWHVTVRFLGRAEVAEADAALTHLVGRCAVAVLGPRTGCFGRRVLHIPVAGLGRLAAAVATATAGVGAGPEERPFRGHLTLARVARDATADLRALGGVPVSGRWPVDELCLVESHLSPAGVRYEVVGRYPLC